jgi:hypothetical protein
MTLLFLDGFDSYTNPSDATAGKWSSGNISQVVTGRLADFGAISNSLGRPFAAASTIFIGAAVQVTSYSVFGFDVFNFYDSLQNLQIKLAVDSFGRLLVYRGGSTLIGFSSTFIPLNTWHYLEFSVHVGTGTSGAYIVRINNQIVLQNTGCDTQDTADTTVSAVKIGGNNNVTYDDLYITNSSGSINNGFMGDMRIETLYPSADVSVDLTPINAMGNSNLNASTGNLTLVPADRLYVFRVYCQTNGTVPDGLINFESTNLTAKTKMVIYSDSTDTLGTLITNGVSDEVVGAIANVITTYTFSTPPTLTAGTYYWIGIITDSLVWIYQNPYTAGKGTSALVANTYTSGAPSTPTVSSYGVESPQIAVQILGGTNWSAVNETQEDAEYSYIYSNTPGDNDLYQFEDLTADVQSVYGIQVSPMLRKTHTANRTATVQIQTPTMGTANSSTLAPGINFTYMPTIFEHQSDGTTTWTVSAVNGLEAGITVG